LNGTDRRSAPHPNGMPLNRRCPGRTTPPKSFHLYTDLWIVLHVALSTIKSVAISIKFGYFQGKQFVVQSAVAGEKKVFMRLGCPVGLLL
jgi:hypothetical protein